VFRIEDTDAARDSAGSYDALLDALRWLGLDWDEGPEVGGPHEPYRQSLRRHLYDDAVARLVERGHLYESFSTPATSSSATRPPAATPSWATTTPTAT
jgi:glutamyl-tRNA synthetase